MAASERKSAAALVNAADDGAFEVTAHGRPRVSRVPKLLLVAWRLISWPFRAAYRLYSIREARPG
jgi:hypothetical protein